MLLVLLEEFVNFLVYFSNVMGIHPVATLCHRLGVLAEMDLMLIQLGVKSPHIFVGPGKYVPEFF